MRGSGGCRAQAHPSFGHGAGCYEEPRLVAFARDGVRTLPNALGAVSLHQRDEQGQSSNSVSLDGSGYDLRYWCCTTHVSADV